MDDSEIDVQGEQIDERFIEKVVKTYPRKLNVKWKFHKLIKKNAKEIKYQPRESKIRAEGERFLQWNYFKRMKFNDISEMLEKAKEQSRSKGKTNLNKEKISIMTRKFFFKGRDLKRYDIWKRLVLLGTELNSMRKRAEKKIAEQTEIKENERIEEKEKRILMRQYKKKLFQKGFHLKETQFRAKEMPYEKSPLEKLIFMAKAKPKWMTRKPFYDDEPKTYEEMINTFYEKLIEKITLNNLLKLEKIFWVHNYELPRAKLIHAFSQLYPKSKATAIDIINLFIKTDKKGTGTITWYDFLNHLRNEINQILEKQRKHLYIDLFPPIKGTPKIINSITPGLVLCLVFTPLLMKDKLLSLAYGKYLSANQYGQITFWNLDMEFEKTESLTFYSTKTSKPVVTDIAGLPDFHVLAFSTADMALTFYDVQANSFEMKMKITHLPQNITKLHYKFFVAANAPSVLLASFTNGSIVYLRLFKTDGGPFAFQLPTETIDSFIITYDKLLQGLFPKVQVIEIDNLHSEAITYIRYFPLLNLVITTCNSDECSLIMAEYKEFKIRRKNSIKGGVSCFCMLKKGVLYATGGTDGKLRIWHFKDDFPPLMTFEGHSAKVVLMEGLYNAKNMYTMCVQKIIKVWNIDLGECIMTLEGALNAIGPNMNFTLCYNSYYRTLLIADRKIALIKLGFYINYKLCDGITHTKAVTVVIYNPVFELVVTVGMDSNIFFWKSFTGEKLFSVQKAHVKTSNGEEVIQGITAATFSNKWIYLLTGAEDGTIKVWDIHSGTSLKSLKLKYNCPITHLVWPDDYILAMGWYPSVKMWYVNSDSTKDHSVYWEQIHTDDILAACFCHPNKVVTATYTGELAFSSTETLLPYRMYFASSPDSRVTDSFVNAHKEFRNPQSHFNIEKCRSAKEGQKHFFSARDCNYCINRFGPARIGISAVASLFSRPCQADVGSVVVALETGWVQIWSHSQDGGMLDEFYAVHVEGDYILCMTSDCKNNYLFTGSYNGYVKVWHLENFVYPKEDGPNKICWPLLRLKFPLLIRSSIFLGRAERTLKNKSGPKLLSSYRAHLKAVSSMTLMEVNEILITSSYDHTARYWTYGGVYLGTLGSLYKFPTIIQGRPIKIKHRRIPRDIRRVASSTTLHICRRY
ncbi:WD repeat-containing protein on Y chromosome-like isoform X2 [Rhodnius prolixus]|uniref:WD repeat-containing protein on Y chromosome-like isoform X2 n=1 Tax=Rhodnius prolixus TaxID=13249 RepID=UPI003D18F651